MIARQVSLLFVSSVLACAGAGRPLPPYFTAKDAHPRYPASRFITGTGVSAVSIEDAGQRAQAEVAAQISSQLESEMVSFEESSTRRGETQDVRSRTRVRSEFRRNDLVSVVETAEQGGAFHAFAVLDREVAARELASSMAQELAAFRASARAAVDADSTGRPQVFATAASQASRLAQDVDQAFVQRRAIAGRPAPEEKDYVAARDQLRALVQQHKARRVVGVVLKAAGAGHLGDFAVNAVRRLGLRPDGLPCERRGKVDGADATELSVEPVESCGEGSLGERCEVTVHLTARACEGDTSGAGTVATVRAVHPSDREKARRSAWEKVTQQAVESAVREALASALQIGD